MAKISSWSLEVFLTFNNLIYVVTFLLIKRMESNGDLFSFDEASGVVRQMLNVMRNRDCWKWYFQKKISSICFKAVLLASCLENFILLILSWLTRINSMTIRLSCVLFYGLFSLWFFASDLLCLFKVLCILGLSGFDS